MSESVKFSNVRGEAWALIKAHQRPLLVGLLLMVIGRLAGLVLPASSKFLIDTVLGEGRADMLGPLVFVVGVATLIQASASFGLARVVSIAAQRAIRDMRSEILARVIRLPVSFFDSTKSGALISRVMNDPEGIRNLVGTGLVQLVGGLFTATIALGVLIWINATLTVGAIVFLLLFVAIMVFAFSKLRPIFRKRWEITEEVTGRLGETMSGVRLVKVYTAESREGEIFDNGVDRIFRNIASTITGSSAVAALSGVIVGAISLLIMVVGGRAILAGEMTLGDIVMYVAFVAVMVAPLVQIASIGTQISEAFAGLDRIREIREMVTEEGERGDTGEVGEHGRRSRVGEEPARARAAVDGELAGTAAAPLEGDVVFEDVTFGYEPDEPVLRDISLRAEAGTTTALVGPSGAGKSTIINLVMAFHRPQEGRILVDGGDLSSLRLGDYRAQIGVVLQDNFLFDGTLEENIRYSRPDATDTEVREAARVAHCDEFVDRFSDGYETVVGERGVKLSGGQRQRVAIARAILADPRILILDEATSSLDSESEALIQDGLRRLRKGRTTFVIAHRLSTIRSADQILVLEDGRIVERGAHAELLAADGLYRRLYERQRGLEEDLFINPGEDPLPGDDYSREDRPRSGTASRAD